MNHEQNVRDSRFNLNGSDCVPALLACLINTVQADQATLILKDQGGQLEADALMLALIEPIFPLILFVAHGVYT